MRFTTSEVRQNAYNKGAISLMLCLALNCSALLAQCTASFTYTVDSSNIFLTNTSTGGYISLVWQAAGSAWADSGNQATFTVPQAGNYWISLTLYDSLGSICDSAVQMITVPPNINCNASFTFSVSGNDILLTNTSTGDYSSVQWYDQGGTWADSGDQATFTVPQDGDYWVVVSVDDSLGNFCDSAGQMITVVDSIVCNASFTYTVSGNDIFLMNTSTGDYNAVGWYDLGSNWTGTGDQTLFTALEPENYQIGNYLLDINGNVCDSAINVISVGEHLSAVNIITPNNDGNQDAVHITCDDSKIYNRYGVLVKMLNGRTIWDGTDDNGKLVPMGEYTVLCIDESAVMRITVIR